MTGETPPRVVIQEAVRLAERFGTFNQREVRQRRARRLRATGWHDLVRILLLNWQDHENPQAGGAEIHLHEIFGRIVSRGHEVRSAVRRVARLQHRERRSTASKSIASARGTPFRSLRARIYSAQLAGRGYDCVVEDINKIPLYTPRWGARRLVALVPHLFGATAFREASIRWPPPCGWPSGHWDVLYRDVPFQAISESTADDLVARGIPRERIGVIYPGVDSTAFTPAPGERSRDSAVRVSRPAEEIQGRGPRHPRVRRDPDPGGEAGDRRCRRLSRVARAAGRIA